MCARLTRKVAQSLGNSESFQIPYHPTVKKILENIPEGQNTCLILGGEPTVRVVGKGKGGRNQELVLRILKNTQKLNKITIASMGTDGIDGNSNFAGAIIENIKVDLTTMKEFLKNNKK